jgi:hypothetical protein
MQTSRPLQSHELQKTSCTKTANVLRAATKDQTIIPPPVKVVKINARRSRPFISSPEALVQIIHEYQGHKLQKIAASKLQPAVKLTHGGPKAFGLGLGLVEVTTLRML